MSNIKVLREAAGLLQSELAEKMGVNQSAVSQWETGATLPRAALLPALAEILCCTINDLFSTEAV